MANIKLLILDVDGVLTDGKIWLTNDGAEYKSFNTQDGLGIRRLLEANVEVAVISGRNSPIVTRRMEELGLKYIFQGQHDKLPALELLCERINISHDQIAYMGDDLPDLAIMQKIGLAMAPCNAVPEVLQFAHWTATRAGGDGAVREACDYILGLA